MNWVLQIPYELGIILVKDREESNQGTRKKVTYFVTGSIGKMATL